MKIPLPAAMRVGDSYKHANPLKSVSELKDHLRKNYNPKDPLFKESSEGRNINNLWSGYELGGKGKLLTTGSLLGGGALIVSNPNGYKDFMNRKGITAESQEMDVESMISTRGDASGYTAPSAAGWNAAPSDLVFALHKTRHSGQF